jgi:hypothetical protein
MRVLETQGKIKNRRDCMWQFKAAWKHSVSVCLRHYSPAQAHEKRGRVVGRNLRIDYRWGIGDAGWIRSALENCWN